MTAGGVALRRLLLGRTGDRLLAAASFVVLLLASVFIADSSPPALDLVVALISSVPLAWRRVAPLPVLVLAMVGPAAQGLLLGSHTTNIGQFVVLLVQLFSFGTYAARRDLPAGLLVSVVAILCVQLTDPVSTGSEDVFTPPVLTLLPFLAGRLLRRQIESSRRLKRLTEQLDRQREADARAATLAERARIAREVHDVVAHSVGVMVVQAGAAEELLEGDPAATRQALAAVRSTGRDALGELRRLLGLMVVEADDIALAPQPGLDELEVLLEGARTGGQTIATSLVGEPIPLSPGVDLAAYRIIQEALTNARKHGGGTTHLCVGRDRGGVTIEVRDEGRTGTGVEPVAASASVSASALASPSESGSGGHGLVGMRERVALYDGTLTVGPDGDGWRVWAWLPSNAA